MTVPAMSLRLRAALRRRRPDGGGDLEQSARPRLLGLRRLGVGLLLGLAAGLVLAMLGPLVAGGRTLSVLTGSMEPTLHVGDLVVDRTIPATRIQVGDVVTFRSPDDAGKLITHRVRRVSLAPGTVRVTTKGDANLTVERWSIPADGTVGRVVTRVPKLGYLLVWTRTPVGRMLLIVLPACLLGITQLWRIWTKPGA